MKKILILIFLLFNILGICVVFLVAFLNPMLIIKWPLFIFLITFSIIFAEWFNYKLTDTVVKET